METWRGYRQSLGFGNEIKTQIGCCLKYARGSTRSAGQGFLYAFGFRVGSLGSAIRLVGAVFNKSDPYMDNSIF